MQVVEQVVSSLSPVEANPISMSLTKAAIDMFCCSSEASIKTALQLYMLEHTSCPSMMPSHEIYYPA